MSARIDVGRIKLFVSLLIATVALAAFFGPPAHAQSIRIQTWNGFGIPAHHSYRYGYWGYGYPTSAFDLGIPFPAHGFAHVAPLDPFAFRYGYGYGPGLSFGSRFGSDYGLGYGFGGRWENGIGDDPFVPGFGLPLAHPYRPPYAAIEPFDRQPDPRLDLGLAPRVAFPADTIPSDTIPGDTIDALHDAATRLRRSLSRRADDADIWLDYLGVDRIIASIDDGQPDESLRDVLQNYDGVIANPELRTIVATDGFASTRRWLRQWIGENRVEATKRVPVPPAELPVPPPVPAPARTSNRASA
jgi:hypothetical protein